jgi:hypothetical protein
VETIEVEEGSRDGDEKITEKVEEYEKDRKKGEEKKRI